ncbi:YkuS family protein [Alkaliphilus serpentinus]|uniref:YkuS family protein n=1 Tax=Alkaliphilus serpentinus TaxID=1482731 RepID=A0A833HRJ4_9FIRM|nr:YkuS family protein [Alkaliphilus serpentinus]KAB3533211.1 hypothetical protein F8153_01295 [Alkaliphilus serpentinus]
MAKKTIAVQEGLHNVASHLKEAGYKITTIDDGSAPIDLIVYSTKNMDYIAHNTSGTLRIGGNNKYVKMINVDEVGLKNIISTIEELN